MENIRPNDDVVGAVHTVVAHPTNANILYAGGVNGGVWRTENATASSPHWEPLTDDLPSLSISALEMDPTDPERLLAGTGRYSAFAQGGGLTGLMLTEDGGDTWAVIDDPLLLDRNISSVALRDNLMLAAAGGGFFSGFDRVPEGGLLRSTDAGETWASIEVVPRDEDYPDDPIAFQVLDLVDDPTDTNRFYAAVQDVGIFRSDDGGEFWTNVTEDKQAVGDIGFAIVFGGLGSNNNTEMEVAPLRDSLSGAIIGSRLYTAVLENGQLEYFGYTDDFGGDFTAMDLPLTNESTGVVGLNPTQKPGGQGGIHFSIAVDPNDSKIVYLGGDRQDGVNASPSGNSIGAKDFSGRLFRGNTRIRPTGAVPSPQWQHLTHSDHVFGVPGGGTRSGSAPHADSRDMTFDADGDLIEVDDGGIYRRTSPRDNRGDWFSIIGDLQVTEFHDIAYDSNSNVIFGGTQDVGNMYQSAPGSTTWLSVHEAELGFRLNADGGDVAVDDTSMPGYSIRYVSTQNLGLFRRQIYDAGNNLIRDESLAMPVDLGFGTTIVPHFVTPIELNTVDQRRLLVAGANAVFESVTRGANFSTVPFVASVGVNRQIRGVGRNQNAIAYGGSRGGVPNPNVLYVGSEDELLVRTRMGDPLVLTRAPFPGGRIVDIVLDPHDWATAFVMDRDRVYVTTDVGGHWRDITGDLADAGAEELRSMVFVEAGATDGIVVGTNRGTFVTLTSDLGVWEELGSNLPNTPVYDLDFDLADDVLVAGTLGRGAWLLTGAASAVLAVGEGEPVEPELPPVGSISGIKWNDLDGDGKYQPLDGERGLPSFYIYVDLNGDDTPGLNEPSALTSATGHYRIANVPVGTRVVREAASAFTEQTYPLSGEHSVIVKAGIEVTNVDFGNQVLGVTAVNDAFEVFEGSKRNPLDVLQNDVLGPGGSALEIAAVGPTSGGGTVGIVGGTILEYTPADQFTGKETFTYTVTDDLGNSDQATVTVDVLPVEDEVVAVDDEFTVDEDSADNVLDVLANDTTPAGTVLTITNVGPTSAGGLVTIAGGATQLLYAPPDEFSGVETFTYTASNSAGASDQATVTIQVNPVNDNPTANDDVFTVIKDSTGNVLDVLANDTSAPDAGEILTIVNVGVTSQGGTATIVDGGRNVLYAPLGGFQGTETFSYTIADGNGGTDLALVTVHVQPSIDMVAFHLRTTDLSGTPISGVSLGDRFLLQVWGEDLRIDPQGVFAGFLDVTHNTLVSVDGPVTYGPDYPNEQSGNTTVPGLLNELGASDSSTPLGGGPIFLLSLPFSADNLGTVTFAGNPADLSPIHDVVVFGLDEAVPVDMIQYGTVSITVTSNQFAAHDDAFDVAEGSVAQQLDVLANDTLGPAGGALAIAAVGPTSHGGFVAIVDGNTMLEYTPAADFFGTETFTYTLANGLGDTDQAVVTIDVVAVNDDPVANPDFFDVDSDTTGNVLDVLANDTLGPDQGETLVITGVGATSNGGAVAITINGRLLQYAPAAGFTGTETFTYTIGDGNGGSDQALVTVDVQGPGVMVQITLGTTDLEGNPISSVVSGEDFLLRATVQDVQAEPTGVFSAYLDVLYDASLASVAGAIVRGPDYPNSPSGNTATPGLINEVGGADGLSLPAGTEGVARLLFSLQMTAGAVGALTFTGEPADVSPLHDVTVFGSDDAVPLSQIAFVSATVSIETALLFTNAANPLDVNADGYVSPVDALVVINDLNRFGARVLPAAEAVGFAALAASAEPNLPTKYVDVNGDSAVSPIDALIVINALNRAAAAEMAAAQAAGGVAAAATAPTGVAAATAPPEVTTAAHANEPAAVLALGLPADSGLVGAGAVDPWAETDRIAAPFELVDSADSTPQVEPRPAAGVAARTSLGVGTALRAWTPEDIAPAGLDLDSVLAAIAADVASVWEEAHVDDAFGVGLLS